MRKPLFAALMTLLLLPSDEVARHASAAGTGSDSVSQNCTPPSFSDNEDGTITDTGTGLMWEKKSDDGTIHDKDNIYSWSTGTNNMDGTMVTTFLATLNGGGGFAGYTDWRIPNRNELLSITNLEKRSPATFAEFNVSCAVGCTVTTCSCTQSGGYWSSSTYQYNPSGAWVVGFGSGFMGANFKTYNDFVRAVRSGS